MSKDREIADIEIRSKLLSEKLRNIVKVLDQEALARFHGVTTETTANEGDYVRAYNETLARIDKLAEEQRQLLIKVGIWPDRTPF